MAPERMGETNGIQSTKLASQNSSPKNSQLDSDIGLRLSIMSFENARHPQHDCAVGAVCNAGHRRMRGAHAARFAIRSTPTLNQNLF